MPTLTIATRESALALWQANHIKQQLEAQHSELECVIRGMTTEGDRNKVSPLSQMGGKGVFVKELETALLDGSADIAVHSMKDVPGELPAGLGIHAMVSRADPRDAFISRSFSAFADMPEGAVVGSSSLRRVIQLQGRYPQLTFRELRGNVDTRLRKLNDGDYDAIVLAVAGLTRLGRADEITHPIDSSVCLPAAGQGAIGIECRSDDGTTRSLLSSINDEATFLCVDAERRVTAKLGATCNLPIAVFAEAGDTFQIGAFVASLDGSETIQATSSGEAGNAALLADSLGDELIARGALQLMSAG